MTIKLFNKIISNGSNEGPIETGRAVGMDIETILNTYLKNRGQILSILRMYENLTIKDLAGKIDTDEKEIEDIESGKKNVPFQWAPKLSKIFNIDLNMVLLVFGHRKSNEVPKESQDMEEFKMAAQYSGPELTVQEKIDMNKMFKLIFDNIKKRRNKE